MNTENFVASVKEVVRNPAIDGVQSILENPPGRSPHKTLLELSAWYKTLPETDRSHVKEIIKKSVDSALFGFLCVIDGVRSFDPDGNDGTLEVLYHRPGKTVSLAPNEDSDYLHDIYKYDD
jgi:hypothetical protein